jgi:hypothetical protein
VEAAEKAIISTLEYAQSLEATPAYSITSWIPPVGLRLATVIVLEAAGKTGVEAYENGQSPSVLTTLLGPDSWDRRRVV